MLYIEIIGLVQLWPCLWPGLGLSWQALRNGTLALEPVALLTSLKISEEEGNFVYMYVCVHKYTKLPDVELPNLSW